MLLHITQVCSCTLPNHPQPPFLHSPQACPQIPSLNILFSNILRSLTKFHTHTKQTSSYARCYIITAVLERIQAFQDATSCLVKSQSSERDVFTSELLESNLHWIAHFRPPPQPHLPPSFRTFLSFYLLMAIFCLVFRGSVCSTVLLVSEIHVLSI
jgi:hypothetical protein